MQSLLTISGVKTGLPFGHESIGPIQILNTNSGEAITTLTTSGGNDTITVPGTNYVGCVIRPPSGNQATLTLKGASGDTGIPLHQINPTVISIIPGTASFVLSCGTSGIVVDIMWF